MSGVGGEQFAGKKGEGVPDGMGNPDVRRRAASEAMGNLMSFFRY